MELAILLINFALEGVVDILFEDEEEARPS